MMKTFKEYIRDVYLKETLNQNEKDQVAAWAKRTPSATKATDHYFGRGVEDKHEPLLDTQDKSETHRAVERHLGHEISSDNYKQNLTRDKGNTAVPRIDKMLDKTNAPESLKNEYKSDNTRKSKLFTGLSVRTTRSPEGIAGQTSHNQSWEQGSCKNIENGSNKHYLPDEVEHGTVVSYLHDHTGKEIARATFQPHINDKGHTAYKKDSYYGIKHDGFLAHNDQLEKDLSGEHKGGSLVYIKHPKVYDDNNIDRIVHPNAIDKVLADKNANADDLHDITMTTGDPKVHKLILAHKNTGANTLSVYAENTTSPEEHKLIVAHENADADVLSNVAENTRDPEVHKLIVANKNADDDVLSHVAYESKDPEIHKLIVAHENADNAVLRDVASHTKDPEIHKLIKLKREWLKSKYKLIVAHKNTGADVLGDVVGKTNDPEVHKAILAHENADNGVLRRVYRNTDIPEVYKLIAGHKNADNGVLGSIARNTKDPEIHKLIVAHKNADDDVLGDVAERTRDPEVHKLIKLKRE